MRRLPSSRLSSRWMAIITLPSAANLINGDLVEYEVPTGGTPVGGLTPGNIYKIFLPNPADQTQIKLQDPNITYGLQPFAPPTVAGTTITLTNHGFTDGEAVTYHAPAADTFHSVQVDVDPNSAIYNTGTKSYNNVPDNNNIQFFDSNGNAASWGFATGNVVRYSSSGGAIDGLTSGADYKVVTVGGPSSSSIQLGDDSSL